MYNITAHDLIQLSSTLFIKFTIELHYKAIVKFEYAIEVTSLATSSHSLSLDS